MSDLVCMAVGMTDVATMCVALVGWVIVTALILNSATRTERGLWEIRRKRH